MITSHLKLAYKVLLRRKFFTFVSLFGTSLTLLSDLNHAYGLLREALAVDRAEQLNYIQSRFQDLTVSADKTLQESEVKNPDPNRRNVTEGVLAFGVGGGNVKGAEAIGKAIAERSIDKGIKRVVFDRSGFLYHGRIRAVADAARKGGLEF